MTVLLETDQDRLVEQAKVAQVRSVESFAGFGTKGRSVAGRLFGSPAIFIDNYRLEHVKSRG
ncbi:hypothetical protein [Massilia sp. PWRC2]|uniref:hypothetical protein n=1 Tax=Massilia sp. PWRC2 TaxID=2804626 RepID=UPI003CF6DA8F